MDGWMDGWMDDKKGRRISISSNKRPFVLKKRHLSEVFTSWFHVNLVFMSHRLSQLVTPFRTELVRDFIADALYNVDYGYFSSRAAIYTPFTPLNFSKLPDKDAYWTCLQKMYDNVNRERDSWHTAVELFKPWFGRAIANYLLQQYNNWQNEVPLLIYEIGGGNGTLMVNILDYIEEHAPQIYQSCSYILYEISPGLYQRQKEALALSKHVAHVSLISGNVLSTLRKTTWPCFVVATELLDNMPHDVVMQDVDGNLSQTYVCTDMTRGYMWEDNSPLTDPLIKRYMDFVMSCYGTFRPPSVVGIWSTYFKKIYREFIPTTAMQLMENLCVSLPKARLIFADFSELPNTVPMGVCSPVVQCRLGRETITCSTYLVKRGQCDIFFPTQFERLSRLWSYIKQQTTYKDYNTNTITIMNHKAFMSIYAEIAMTRLQSGFNPLLDDYVNSKFLLTT
jgi:hypothetical protein